MSWFDSLVNNNLKNAISAIVADNSVTYNETLSLLQAAATGGITASEFSDLQTIYANCQSIFASSYVGYIANAYVKGNPYNAKWWGGATSTANVALLGDLTAGMSELNATRLVKKWFLGTDLPMPVAGGDTAKGLSATFIASYTTATGSLFVNGVAASDVSQGYAGTCYLDSVFGAVAKAKPNIITSAFTDNGNNTYGVRFYFDGKPVYTTIDKEVPVYNGSIAFVGNNTKSTSGELWTTLLEKAYAQLNAQFNLDGSNSKEASYQAIEGGLAYPIKQLTGLNYKYYTSYYQSIPDNMDSGTYYSATSSTYKQTIINALNSGAVGWLGSWGATTGSNGKKEFVAGHAYMLLGYNSSTDKFTVRNPWGDTATGNYNAQFDVSIDTFWNSNVKGLVALSDSAAVDPTYTYTIASSAATALTAVSEGAPITFTISRNSSGAASIVYISTRAVTAGGSDYQNQAKTAISFDANETTKTISLNTYTDSLTEGAEYFYVDLYDHYTDTTPQKTAIAYIKDAVAPTYAYTLTTAAKSLATAVDEGGTITFTITRSSSGSASTVYVSTRDGTAGTSDYGALAKTEVAFAANETVKTVTVGAYTDSLVESAEYLYLDLYKNYSDTTASTSAFAYIKDKALPAYTYTLTSSASTSATAATEGDVIHFTIKRSGSGSSSTVYLSTANGTASGEDYVGVSKQALTFEANQLVLDFDVKTSTDWWLETSEYFTLNLYKSYSDATTAATGIAFIKDTVADPYNYKVTSPGSVAEGGQLTFTITRSSSGSASTVYVSTASGSAGGADFSAFNKQAITFAANELQKTVAVNTFTDSLAEGTEYFYLNLLKNYSDAAFTTYASGYITDSTVAAYTYTVSSSTPYASPVTEGGSISFTITRSSSGSASTVYVSTTACSADGSDYSAITKQAVSFAAYETTKTITIDTFTDSLSEGTEYFYLDLFKNYSDPTYCSYGTGCIKDATAPSYSYAIGSAARTITNAVVEGGPVTFTITRSSSGSASTVYVSTAAGTAGESDYEGLYKQAVNFAAYETTKTITIDTFTDSLTEGTEYFYVNLFKTYADTNYAAYGYAYIKDNVTANYTYSIASSATYSTPATEGGSISFTITRSGTGSASSVYVTTTPGSAGAADFAAFNKLEVDFAANERTKTVTVNTYTDSLTEGTEYFYLDLFKNYSDNSYSTYGSGYIGDVATASFTYTLSSSASTQTTAVAEGNSVTFTITRSGTGTASTVYVSTYDGTAGYSDYGSLYKRAVFFGTNETTKTVTVSTYTDGQTEAPEYFGLALLKNYSDTSGTSYANAYIKDSVPSYSYSVTSTAGYGSPVTEGGAITFTITRNGTGTASTIYASTTASSAGSSDYTAITKQAISFGASETTKTITVYTTADSLTEATELFFLDLFKYSTDSLYSWYGSGYIKDPTTSSTLAAAATPANTAPTSTLTGSARADVVTGSAANEVLYGGGGADTLIGGGGADVFRYVLASEGGDSILDFRAEDGDTLAFVSANFGSLAVGNLQAANFTSNATGMAVDAQSRFLFNTSNGVLRYDADGIGSGAGVTIATLNTRALHASNIMLVA